jgi:uncharacterized membrane protein YfcA
VPYYDILPGEAQATTLPRLFCDVFSVLVFTVPGVIVGAQVGVRLAGAIDAGLMGRLIGGLFAVLAVLTLLLVFR